MYNKTRRYIQIHIQQVLQPIYSDDVRGPRGWTPIDRILMAHPKESPGKSLLILLTRGHIVTMQVTK